MFSFVNRRIHVQNLPVGGLLGQQVDLMVDTKFEYICLSFETFSAGFAQFLSAKKSAAL
jgi:hypothetical protein